MTTICYIAHPDISDSSSQQFLIQSGKWQQSCDYVDLANKQNWLDAEQEGQRLSQYDQIIFQFPLYWYQAPALLKQWLDVVWEELPVECLKGKSLGLVIVVGAKASHYQAGGRVGRTLSELLSSYEVLAKHFGMAFRPIFAIYQFQYLSEVEKQRLMWEYLFYLSGGDASHFRQYQRYLIEQAKLNVPKGVTMSEVERMQWEQMVTQLELSADELEELMDLVNEVS